MNDAKKNTISLAGLLITLAGAIMFSTKAIMVKLAFAHTPIDALTLLTLRMIFSLPFFLAAAFFASNTKGNVRMNRRQWMWVIALGLFGYYLSSLFDFIGLQYISAGLERLILFLYPTFAVLINAFLFKQAIPPHLGARRQRRVITHQHKMQEDASRCGKHGIGGEFAGTDYRNDAAAASYINRVGDRTQKHQETAKEKIWIACIYF